METSQNIFLILIYLHISNFLMAGYWAGVQSVRDQDDCKTTIDLRLYTDSDCITEYIHYCIV